MLHEKLDRILSELDITNAALARACGVDASLISRYRSGSRRPSAKSAQLSLLCEGIMMLAEDESRFAALCRVLELDQKCRKEAVATVLEQWLETADGVPGEENGMNWPACIAFGEKLDLLMKAFDVSNIRMARALNVDSSLISRYRTGARRPSEKSDIVERICLYYANLAASPDNGPIFAELTGATPSPQSTPEEFYKHLRNWFLRADWENRPQPVPEPDQASLQRARRQKMKRVAMWAVAILIAVPLTLGALFPGLLWCRSLGVQYTVDDYISITHKLDYLKDAAPKEEMHGQYEYVYGDTRPVEVEVTSAEITAFYNENRPPYYAVKNVQVKIGDNGTMEAVATVDVEYFLEQLMDGMYTKEDLSRQVPGFAFLPNHVNVYLRAAGTVRDNQAQLAIEEVTLQGIPVSRDALESHTAAELLAGAINHILQKSHDNSGTFINQLDLRDGVVRIHAEFPTSLTRIKKNDE